MLQLPVLVVTTCWWPSLARLVQLLQRAGCQVTVLCPPGHAAAKAEGVLELRHDPLQPIRALLRAIHHTGAEIVVPGDDRTVAHLHQLHAAGSAQVRSIVERSLGAPKSYDAVLSRTAFATTARACGMRVPEDADIESEADLRRWCARIPPPWVIKIDGTWSGRGVRIAPTLREAVAAFHELQRGVAAGKLLKRAIVNRDLFWAGDKLRQQSPRRVSVQSYLPGQPGNLAMFCSNGHVAAFSAVLTEACIDPTGPSVLVRTMESPALREGVARLASRLGLSGFYGLDFIVDEYDGVPVLLEMNPRATSLANLRLGADRDLIGAAVQAWSGHPSRVPPGETTTRLIAHFPLCWHWNAQDPRLPDCHADIPNEEPELLQAMLAPAWPDQQPLARLLARWRSARARRVLSKGAI